MKKEKRPKERQCEKNVKREDCREINMKGKIAAKNKNNDDNEDEIKIKINI